jgi:hypothetical protein
MKKPYISPKVIKFNERKSEKISKFNDFFVPSSALYLYQHGDRHHSGPMSRRLAMSRPLTKRTIDRSDSSSFSFSFLCDRCSKKWESQTVPFNNGGFTVIENDEGRKLLWADKHRTAFNEANLEARLHFNRCSECGSWVCEDCLAPDTGKPGFNCKDCEADQSCNYE